MPLKILRRAEFHAVLRPSGTRQNTAFSPHFSLLLGALEPEGPRMKSTIALVALALLTSSAAMAQERAGDAALGALSGAVVLGPIGAVAGAVVGYAAGPHIADSWGLRRRAVARPEVPPPAGEAQPAPAPPSQPPSQSGAPSAARSAPHSAAYNGPPAQGL